MTAIKENLTLNFKRLGRLLTAPVALGLMAVPAFAQDSDFTPPTLAEQATYADLTSLAERSDMVIRAEIRRQIEVEPERSPGLAPGFVRLYIEAETIALISGRSAVGESLAYLIDVPLNARGRAERLKGREMLLFADSVPGRPGFVQLTGKNAQLDYSPELEARLRPILTALVADDVPPVVTGVRDALAVPGNLVGESETQIFLTTTDRSPVSVTVLRRPGQRPVWGVSWGEIIDSSSRPPQPSTLRWYRLACALPQSLPSNTNLARDASARRLAQADYAFVMDELGSCPRAITEPDEA